MTIDEKSVLDGLDRIAVLPGGAIITTFPGLTVEFRGEHAKAFAVVTRRAFEAEQKQNDGNH